MNKKVLVHDTMQHGYTYVLTAPEGKNFDPVFTPQLTPKELLELGIFGGIYMRDCKKEFPQSWFVRARFAPGKKREKNLNYFRVQASQSLGVWRANGWINQEHDPRGWFQWYCRYYRGRRIPTYDAEQIKRWKAMRRHVAQIKKYCRKGDYACRARQRQALLHWAYDSRTL